MSRKAGPEHEMNDLRRQSMDTALLDRTGGTATTPSKQRGLKLRDWIRQLRLQILLLRFRRPSVLKASAEPRKVAMYHSRRVAILHALLHCIPLGGAITLLYFQWSQLYIGWESPPDATILQFVAKFHELLMQVSIVEVMLCIVRAEAIHGFVPLGALSGIVQATQLSYLWSLDFISLFASAALRGWRKFFLAIAFPILLAITALVGPSSAVLMIPRPGTSRVGQNMVVYAYASEDSMFPSNISRVNGLTLNWYDFGDAWKPGGLSSLEKIQDIGDLTEDSVYELRTEVGMAMPKRPLRVTSRLVELDNTGHLYSATVPTQFIMRVLRDLDADQFPFAMPEVNGNYTASVYCQQPVVQSICASTSGEALAGDTELRYVKDDMATLDVLGDLDTTVKSVQGQSVLRPDPGNNLTWQFFPPVWTESPEEGSHSWIGTFIYAGFYFDSDAEGNQSWLSEPVEITNMFDPHNATQNSTYAWTVASCTISAAWNRSEAVYLGATRDGQMQQMPIWKTHAERPIAMTLTDFKDFVGARFVQNMVELDHRQLLSGGALAASFATAISNIPTANWTKRNEISQQAESANTTAYTITNTYFGFGYGTTTTSIRLSMAVICAYCIIIICYLAFTLITGHSSTAWNSAIELVALALQSKKPDHLGSVSVGIDNLGTFNEGVGIRVNADNELELVFAHDRDIGARDLRKIQKNREY